MSLLQPGGTFGDFEVLKELGRGGMGAVYLVRDPETGERYAAKVMLENPLHGDDFKRRFIREAEIAMAVDHPNLVKVYDVGRDPETGLAYMIMDYVDGGDLHEALARRLIERRGPYRVKEALAVIRPLLGALSAASAAGVVHRDIKPDNILFDGEGKPLLTDLGVAKLSDDQTLTRLTMSNMVVGTPAYMAPEQMTDSHAVDVRSDLYSLGLVLWEMLAGECPNAELSAAELMARALKGTRIRDIRTLRPKLPLYVLRFMRRMTDPRPERRFATPDEALRFLNEWKAQEDRKFRIFLAVTAVVTTILIATILAVGIRWIRQPTPASVPAASETSVPKAESEVEDSEFSIPESVK